MNSIRTGPRILMLTHQCAGMGGSFMRAVSLARPLVEMGFDLTLIASRAQIGLGNIQSDWHGIKLIQMPDLLPWRIRNAGLSPMDLCARMVEVWGGRFDLFHVFDHRPAASIPPLLRLDKEIPIVSDWADLWGHEGFVNHRHEFASPILGVLDNVFEPYVHKNCRALTAISGDLRKRAIQLGVSPDWIRIVQVGANGDIVKPMDKEIVRAKYHIPLKAPVVAYCGFSALDMDLLADSFARLVNLVPDILLIMAGARVAPFEGFIKRNGWDEHVRQFGMVPYEDLGEVLSCGDAMLLPYKDMPVNRARFPNRFGDYLAVGRPIATNRVGDHSAIVEQEQIGIVTSPDPQSFAEGIAGLLTEPDRRAEMGANARRLALTRFSWKAIAAPVAALYTDLLR